MGEKKRNYAKTVVVLGMHLSGIFMIADILHHLGVNMGKNLMEANWANPLGYFENSGFVQLNNEILKAAGGSWDNPPETQNILAQKEKFAQRIQDLIQKEKSEIWGWKDPRTNLTIELYLSYLENPYFLVCYRNPLNVAESLKRRDGTSIEFGLKLTGIYNQRIINFFYRYPYLKRLYLPYEEIITYPKLWLKKIINFLGLNPTDKQIHTALKFIKPKFEYKAQKPIPKNVSPKVSIIIPAYNKLEYTKQCLDALYKVTPASLFELIVVNNASSDGTKEYLDQLTAQVDNVKVIHNQENLGFAKACNQGAKVAEGKYLVFLNNDTLPLEGWLEEMIKVIEGEKGVGVVGSKLLFPDNTIQHAGVGITDHPLPVTPFHLFYKRPADYPKANIKRDYQVVTGACMLIPKELFDRLGGFDEGFLNGFEDVDLCFRVKEAGYRIVYTPKSVLYHFESVTPGRFKAVKENEERLQKKWAGKIKPDVEIYFPKVSVIILNYNNCQDTIKCLESIYNNIKYEQLQVIVIDNGSEKEDVLTLKKWIDCQDVESIFCSKEHFLYKDKNFVRELVFIENNENLGFAGGNNVGIRYALQSGADYIWLLNNDTVIEKESLESSILLADRLKEEKQEKVGIISSKIYCYNDKTKVQYDGGKPVYEGIPDKEENCPHPVEFAPFCSVLINRKLLEEIGLLNEDYFLYFEDNEFCLRTLKAGWTIWYNPLSKVYHKGGRSIGSWLQSPLSAYYATRNILLYQTQLNPSKVAQIFAYLKNGYWDGLKKTPECIFGFIEGVKDFLKGEKGKWCVNPEKIEASLKKIKNVCSSTSEGLEERLEASGNWLLLNPAKKEALEQFINIAQALFFKNYAKLAMKNT